MAPNTIQKVDIAVIGAGPGGEKAALTAAEAGATVAIIERGLRPGGASVISGTLPSKSLRETVQYLDTIADQETSGFDIELNQRVSISELMHRHHVVTEKRVRDIRQSYRQTGVHYITGEAQFCSDHRLVIHTDELAESIELEWKDQSGEMQVRDLKSDLGGTMRLGGQVCRLRSGTLAHQCYGKDDIVERHRHRYEVNNTYLDQLTEAGLVISGRSEDGSLVEMVELKDHPWFVACQFHPEFTSTPRDGHGLFRGYIGAAISYRNNKSHQL